MQQLGDSFTPDRRDNAELDKVSPDRVNHRGLLADEEMTCAVKHQVALLLERLCWHKPHVGSRDCLANSLSVSCIVLLTLDVGLHVSRQHQSHGLAKCLQFATNGATMRTPPTRHSAASGRTPGQSGASTGGG